MKKLALIAIATLATLQLIMPPMYTYAADDDPNCVQTSIIGNGEVCDDGNGSSITGILNLAVEIMSIGVGILGVVGITIVGIQYLTAGGSEEKTRKAKRRLIEILIGLAVYAVMAALLSWLLPTFTPKPADTNNSGSSENGGGGGGGSGNRTRPSNPNPGRYNIEN